MRRVAYLTGRSYRGAPMPPGTVPQLEQKSVGLIFEAARARDVSFEIVYWDDPSITADKFDAAVIRSCWDYHQRPDQFVAALEQHERNGVPVFNAPSVVRWNMRKTYLKDLGAAAIETVWADRADGTSVAAAFDALDAEEIVVKPQVGAGSIGTARLKRNAWSADELARDGPAGAAMIQPYLRAIESEGERSLFWFGGAFSHAIRKIPHQGTWLANMPGSTRVIAEAPPAEALAAAEAARAKAPADLLYVRIDLVLGNDGAWRVIEIEAIEPYFFLDVAPEGAGFFVDAITRVLG